MNIEESGARFDDARFEADAHKEPSDFSMAQSSHLGDVSLNVLLDRFRPADILYAPAVPAKNARRFGWYATVSGEESTPENLRDGDVLLCHADMAEALLNRYPKCFCFISAKNDDDFSWVYAPAYRNRVVVFKEERRFYQYDALMQRIFVNDLLWQNDMDRIVYNRGKLDAIIEVSRAMLGNFVCITDTGYNLIACSRGVAPVCPGYQHLVENICLDAREIEYLEKSVLPLSDRRNKIILKQPDDLHECPTLHSPVFIEGAYLFHITMECAHGSVACLAELFDKFMSRVLSICGEFWRTTVNLEAPWHRALISLVEGNSVTRDYLTTQLSMTAIPSSDQFRLLYFRYDAMMSNQERLRVLDAAKKLNDGFCYPFMYQEDLLVLLFSPTKNDAALSAKRVDDPVEHLITEPFGLSAGCSQVFWDIADIRFAYQQAVIAYDYRELLVKEKMLACENANMPVYPFEHALKFYLLSDEQDKALVAQSFKHSILRRLVDEDRDSGTEVARLLWVYLSCDRNATETAKRIHVHRNTVLYHIGRIKERFGIDFDSPFLKSRITLDYVQLMMEEDI